MNNSAASINLPVCNNFLVKKKKYSSLDKAITFFVLLSSILIGADRWGVSLLGVQFKVAEIFLVIATFLMIISKRFYSANNKWVYFFVITSFISFLFGYSIQRGILFYFYIIFNVIFIYFLYFNYAKYYGADKLIKVFRTSFYVNFGVLLFQYLVNTIFGYNIPFLTNYGTFAGVHRYQSFFYEPSYLATYVVFWLACSLFQLFIGKDKGYLIDVALALVMLLISTSSTGFVGIMITLIPVYLYWLFKDTKPKKLLSIILIIVVIFAVKLSLPNLWNHFVLRIFSGDLNGATGGRVALWAETYKVFKENFLFGVGAGNYGLYLNIGAGYVPSNVTLELLATLGIFGFVAFYGFTISLIYRSYKTYKRTKNLLPLALAYGIIAFTIILQVNQGYLRLYHWMFFGMIEGVCYSLNTKKFSVVLNHSC